MTSGCFIPQKQSGTRPETNLELWCQRSINVLFAKAWLIFVSRQDSVLPIQTARGSAATDTMAEQGKEMWMKSLCVPPPTIFMLILCCLLLSPNTRAHSSVHSQHIMLNSWFVFFVVVFFSPPLPHVVKTKYSESVASSPSMQCTHLHLRTPSQCGVSDGSYWLEPHQQSHII